MKNYLPKVARILYKLRSYYPRFFKSALPKRDFYSGLVGCGYFVRYAYVPALNSPDIPIVCSGLYSRSIQSAKEVKKMLRYKTRVFTSYEELINSGISSIIITAPNHLHYHYITESLNKNLDVFCEKPVTNSLEDAFRVKSILENSHNIFMVGFNRRYLDSVIKLELLIKKGDIGMVREVLATYNLDIEKHLLQSGWLNDTKKSGGGVVHNAGTHFINIMLHLFGKIEKISAKFQNLKMPLNFGEDTASLRLNFTSGISGLLETSFVSTADNTGERIIIKGDTGVITADLINSNIVIRDNSDNLKTVSCRTEYTADSIYTELLHFYDCLKNRRIPDTDIDDSIETLKVTDAAQISAVEEREVYIEEIDKRCV